MKINQLWLRVMGISGILGGLLLFAGDMLFFYHSTSTDLNLNMGNASDVDIMASGVTALVGVWLYMLGLGQVYFAFKPASNIIRNIVLISFGAILISYGVIHGAYVAIATSAKLAVQHNLELEHAVLLATGANQMLRLLVYPIFALLSFVFIWQVWKRKTLYPRWIVFAFPLLPFLFQWFFDSILTGKMWVIIMGGYLNLLLVLFFTASTIALWRVKKE